MEQNHFFGIVNKSEKGKFGKSLFEVY